MASNRGSALVVQAREARLFYTLPLQDQLDRKAFCATFFRIADGVLNVANVVDDAIEGGVGVSADVNG